MMRPAIVSLLTALLVVGAVHAAPKYLDLKKLEAGLAGPLPKKTDGVVLVVEEVIDETTAIIRPDYSIDFSSAPRIMLKGVSTAKWADGSKPEIPGTFKCTGTAKRNGSTYFVLELTK